MSLVFKGTPFFLGRYCYCLLKNSERGHVWKMNYFRVLVHTAQLLISYITEKLSKAANLA